MPTNERSSFCGLKKTIQRTAHVRARSWASDRAGDGLRIPNRLEDKTVIEAGIG